MSVIEYAVVKNDIGTLKKGDKIVVLNRYDISSIAPIKDDICTVYFNGKLYTNILSSYFEVIETIDITKTKKTGETKK